MTSRQQQILQASAREISCHGIRGFRVSEVAVNAGVSTALLYYHFTDRAGLLEAALSFISERAQGYRLVLDTPQDSAWQLLINHVCQEFQDDPVVTETTLAWNEVRASAVYEPGLRRAVSEAAESWRGEIRDSIQLAIDANELDQAIDPAANAIVIVALMEGLGGQWMTGDLPLSEVHAILIRTLSLLLGRETA